MSCVFCFLLCVHFYIIFTDFAQTSASSRRRPLQELDHNVVDNNTSRRFKRVRTTTSPAANPPPPPVHLSVFRISSVVAQTEETVRHSAIPPSPPPIHPPVFRVPSALAPIEHISAPSHPPAQSAVFRAFSVVAQTAETVRPFLSIRHDTC